MYIYIYETIRLCKPTFTSLRDHHRSIGSIFVLLLSHDYPMKSAFLMVKCWTPPCKNHKTVGSAVYGASGERPGALTGRACSQSWVSLRRLMSTLG
jgi:hypothetical protein